MIAPRALRLAGEPSQAARREDLASVLARFNARGITTIREAGVDAAGMELFVALRDHGRLSLRCDLLWRVAEGSDADAAARWCARAVTGTRPRARWNATAPRSSCAVPGPRSARAPT